MSNRAVFSAVKAEVRIPVFAVGGIRTRAEGDAILAAGEADLVGIGRPFCAEPELPRWFLAGEARAAACESCNRCVVPQMLVPGGCYNPRVKAEAAPREATAY